jgi:peptidyl-prolyl cis-trans isomerase SurA
MNKYLFSWLLFSISLTPLFAGEDVIVAVVNDDIITRSEIVNDLKNFQKNNPKARGLNTALVLPDLLDQKILHTLQMQKVKEFGIKATPQHVKQQISNIAKANGLTLTQLKVRLDKQQKNGFQALVDNVNNKLALKILRNEVTKKKSFATDEEINLELQVKNLALYSYKIGNIFISKPKSDEDLEDYKKKLNLIYQILDKKRATFRQIAHSFSDAKNAKEYGQMGFLTISSIPSIYKRALIKLKVGGISKFIRSNDGTHIIKLYDKKELKQLKQKQTKISHILIAVGNKISDKKAKEKAQEIYQKLQKNPDDFIQLARRYSKDISSNRNGGSLGWINNQDILPEFLKNISNQKISKPFKTKFGWHIAKKMGERTQDLTLEKQRKEIKRYIEQKKANEIYAIWLENLQEKSYIKLFKERL